MQTLDALEAWLETHLPEVAEDLNPGATAAALEQFASALGLRQRAGPAPARRFPAALPLA